MLTEQVDAELLAAAGPQLKIVANHAVGFDNVDVAACTAAGVLATNTPDVLTETTADTAFALLHGGRAARRRGRAVPARRHAVDLGAADDARPGRAPQDDRASSGSAGSARRSRAAPKGFGMTVIYSDAVQLPAEVEAETGAERVELDDLLERADFVSIHTNLTPETRHLFGAEQFKRMKPTAVLVNTSRGPVVDEAALADALRVRRDLRRRPRRLRARARGHASAARASRTPS